MLRKVVVVTISLLIVGMAFFPVQAQGTKEFPPKDGTQWGDPVSFGDGEIRTFVTADAAGVPSLVGVYFTEGMLSNLPQEPGDGAWDVLDADGNVVFPCCGHEVELDFPETISATPIKHFILNWNPMGHTPVGVYDIPHFDLHFYTVVNEERLAIPAATADTMCSVPNPPGSPEGEHPVDVDCATFEQGMIPLPEAQLPPGYMAVGAVEPGMGNHLVNPTSPEFNGEPFTSTWIYGTFGGKLTFLEPMITLDFFAQQSEEACYDIPMPAEVSEAGYYPTQYCIRYLPGTESGAGTYAVTLESFQEYDAADDTAANG